MRAALEPGAGTSKPAAACVEDLIGGRSVLGPKFPFMVADVPLAWALPDHGLAAKGAIAQPLVAAPPRALLRALMAE